MRTVSGRYRPAVQAVALPVLQRQRRVCAGRIVACCMGLLLLALLVNGCGFHLRGNIEMPAFLSSIYIKDDHVSRITPVLQESFKTNKVDLAPDAASAKAVLVIDGESFDRRVLSVNSAGKVQDYALLYNVRFSLIDQSKQVLLDQQKIQVERELRFDAALVLAKSAEEAQLNQDMLQDATQQILRRIQFVKPVAGNPSASP